MTALPLKGSYLNTTASLLRRGRSCGFIMFPRYLNKRVSGLLLWKIPISMSGKESLSPF